MEPEIKTLAAFTVMGVKYRGKNEHGEVSQLWEVFLPRAAEIRQHSAWAYGVEGNYDPASGEFDYLAGFEVAQVSDLPAGMTTWDVPAGSFAFFPAKLPEIKNGSVMQYAYQTWLPQSGYVYSSGPAFEFYPEDFAGDQSDMYYVMPVKPA